MKSKYMYPSVIIYILGVIYSGAIGNSLMGATFTGAVLATCGCIVINSYINNDVNVATGEGVKDD